jgi:Spy/CpxP family protein refolding chaperone
MTTSFALSGALERRSKMKKTTLFSLLALLVLAFAGAALAGGTFERVMIPKEGGPDVVFMHGGLMFDKLDLSEEQREALKTLHEELRAETEPVMKQHMQQMEEIHTLLDAGNANATEIGQKMIAAHETEKQLRTLHEAHKERFSALLTEEQREKLKGMEAEHPHRRRMMRHHF